MEYRALDEYLRRCVTERLFPGCVCWTGNRTEEFFFASYGHAQLVPQPAPMTRETVFDLASLTKPIVTALSVMLLHEQDQIDLNAQVQAMMPELKDTTLARKTIGQLLAHTSGLPAWYPLYLIPGPDRLRFLAGLADTRDATVYSCLGYILLGKIVEQIAGRTIDRFFRENVTDRLEQCGLDFGPVADNNVAATEQGNEHEKEMARRYGDVSGIPWRRSLIKGAVHDGNAHYALGGIAGNAGLFGRTLDLVAFLRAYVSGGIIRPATMDLMLEAQTGPPEQRNLGWRVEPYPGLLSPRSYGHTGFTGTMCAVDPETGLIIVLLANAVHPRVRPGVMQPIRREVVRIASQKTG